MKLNQAEIGSPLWQRLKAHHEQILAEKRARLENPRIAEPERIQLAWEIHTIKQFLAIGQPVAEKPETDAG